MKPLDGHPRDRCEPDRLGARVRVAARVAGRRGDPRRGARRRRHLAGAAVDRTRRRAPRRARRARSRPIAAAARARQAQRGARPQDAPRASTCSAACSPRATCWSRTSYRARSRGSASTTRRSQQLHPRLVHCSITGYGHDGPYANRSSLDLVVQAVSGLMAKTGFPDGPPTKVGATVGDQVPAIYAALGVVAALRQRDRDGRGQKVDVAMLDALVLAALGRAARRVRAPGRARARRQRRSARRSARRVPHRATAGRPWS